jgi:archaellum component FlaF (FlaF/FlaG flagellin family)
MNSIDAIIALCALLASFALLLGAINEQQTNTTNALNSLNSKTHALNCASIIDSMFSNASTEYNGELKCEVKNGELNYTTLNKIKTEETLATVTKTTFLEVKINEHYK